MTPHPHCTPERPEEAPTMPACVCDRDAALRPAAEQKLSGAAWGPRWLPTLSGCCLDVDGNGQETRFRLRAWAQGARSRRLNAWGAHGAACVAAREL